MSSPIAPIAIRANTLAPLFDGLESSRGSAEDPVSGTALASLGAVMGQLEEAEAMLGSSRVLVTVHDGATSRLQSAVAAGELGPLKLLPSANGLLEAKFDTRDWGGWLNVAWEKLRHPIRHALLRPPISATPMPGRCKIGILGDWGTGLYGAPVIAASLVADPKPCDVLIHLGDVYYSGTLEEIRHRFLDIWPKLPGCIHRALNSNHEMYAGGYGYFDMTLPTFGQAGSYFALENEHWTLVGLDLAYKDHAIDEDQAAWLERIVEQAGARRIILMSHHQLFSAFETQGDALWAHPRFGQLLRDKRIFAWYWGHEHGCYLYEQPEARSGVWGRCIGHGGMPESRRKSRQLPTASVGDADWRRMEARRLSGNVALPSALVLEGENPYFGEEAEKFTPNGYAVLHLDGEHLVEQVLDPTGRVIWTNQLA